MWIRVLTRNERFCAITCIRILTGQVFYGQSEWERICGPAIKDDEERAVRLRTSAALSSSLVQQCNVLFDFESFPV